jgi:ligand-binding sensor domain-containing protein/DNA-binding CsgD family transcriptional regulator
MNPRPARRFRVAACLLSLRVLLLPSVAPAPTDILTAERLDIENGLPSNEAYFVFQDRSDFLWFAAVPGLARFDGRSWDYYRSNRLGSAGPSSLSVFNMCEDRQGYLWLATSIGVDRFDPRRRSFRHYVHDPRDPASLGAMEVLDVHILSARPDTLWITTVGGGLNSLDLRTEAITRWPFKPGQPNACRGAKAYLMLEDRSGALWVATDQGLNRYDLQRRTFVFHTLPITKVDGEFPETTCMFESAAWPGVLWIASRGGGLLRYDMKLDRWQIYFHHPGDPTSLPDNCVYTITDWPHAANSLLVNTDEGFCRFEPSNNTFTPVRLLANNLEMPKKTGYSMAAIDHSGVLWITSTYQGVFKIIPRRSSPIVYRKSPTPEAPAVTFLTEDRQNRIWITTNYTNNRYFISRLDPRDGSIVTMLSAATSKVLTFARPIHFTPDGLAWIGTSDGLARLDPESGAVHHFNRQTSEPSTRGLNSVNYIDEDLSGRLWLGTTVGVIAFSPATGECRRFSRTSAPPNDLPDEYVRGLLVDERGEIWIGTPSGLNRFDPVRNRFQPVGTGREDGQKLSDSRVMALHRDRKNRLWVGTGYGLNLVRRRGEEIVIESFILPGGELNNTILTLTSDVEANLWIGTSKGMNCLLDGNDSFLTFGPSDDLPSPDFSPNCSMCDHGGRIWMGGWPGIINFQPHDLFSQWQTPPTAISRILLDGKPAPIGPGLPLEAAPPYARQLLLFPTVHALTVECAALDTVRPEQNQFAWRMRDRENVWHHLGFENRFSLSGLSPGRHTLQVKVANHNGRWSPTWTELSITVLPPWWKKREFLLAMAIALLLAALGVRLGLRAYKRKLTRSLADLPAGSEPDLGRYDISAREMEVVRLVLRGRSNKEIEDALFISTSTVKAHLGSVYRKLGVKSRLQLINFVAARSRKTG